MSIRKHFVWLSLSIVTAILTVAVAGAIGHRSINQPLSQQRSSNSSAKARISSTKQNEFEAPELSSDGPGDSLRYPIDPRTGDFVSGGNNNNPFDLKDPPIIQQNVEYDPVTNSYIITETIAGQPYSAPTYMTFDEFWSTQNEATQQQYWQQAAAANSSSGDGEGDKPPLYKGKELFEQIFGGTTVDIRPTGNIEMELGYAYNRVDNPALLSQAQRNGRFLFDMNINMGVTGKIGDKLNIDLRYNTRAAFNFNDQVKLRYAGKEDDIIQEINAGNVNFALPTQLIPGSQNLFGLQTKLRFGRLTINSVVSQQQSQSKTVTLQNGTQVQDFEVPIDQYDENRHFFLAQYFRSNYEKALANLPYINSPVTITRVDVYVMDTRGNAGDVQRDVVAFADLGESQPVNTNINTASGKELPQNGSNDLYQHLISNPEYRNLTTTSYLLQTSPKQLRDIIDFKKIQVRKLASNEYTFDPKLGYISLNTSLNANQLLAVAYEYTTIFGGTYRVGELGENLFTVDEENKPRVLFLKMLKTTTNLPTHPMWNLMMKNIYSLGAYQIQPQDFRLDINYENPGGGELRYIPKGEGVKGIPLIRLLKLDQLNSVNEPYPDGAFDYIEAKRDFEPPTTPSSLPANINQQQGAGANNPFGGNQQQNTAQQYNNTLSYGTINAKTGRLIFPVLEPFGDYLRGKFDEGGNPPETANKYVYDYLYDSTRFVALEFPEQNRYFIRGQYKSNLSSEISLGAFNIPKGAVRVNAGGQMLREDIDYTVDYNLGRLTLLNESILNAGVPIQISFEDNAGFGIQRRTFAGTRLEYLVNKDFVLGATAVHLSERPFTPKVNYGDAPISNSMVGADMRYFSDLPWMTKALDKLPFYSTKEPSTLTFNAEGAAFIPGTAPAIGQNIYLDDFEGSRTETDLRFPFINWKLSSTPARFPEAVLTDSLVYNFNRAKMAWYQIDNVFLNPNQNDLTSTVLTDSRYNAYGHTFAENDLFPNRQLALPAGVGLRSFDIGFYPDERGPYNFDTEGVPGISDGLNSEGRLNSPQTRWGGIMRAFDGGLKDFERSNVEFIEFWMLDPFIYDDIEGLDQRENTGNLYIDLGNVSEDVLRDGYQQYENALPKAGESTQTVETTWGQSPSIQPFIDGFGADEANRAVQDVGLDGIKDDEEQTRRADYVAYINGLKAINTNPLILARLDTMLNDPSGDDYLFFRSDEYSALENNPDYRPRLSYVAERYKEFNGSEGNSPVQATSNTFSTSGTNFPDNEDLNDDKTLSDSEAYFEYKLPLEANMGIGITPYLADVRSVELDNEDGTTRNVKWYYFRVPVRDYTSKVGELNFRNIEGIRMYMTDFKQPTILRFARLNVVRNTWRRYNTSLFEEGEYQPNDNITDSFFELSAINVEENSGRQPIPYIIPPGIIRENVPALNNISVLQNEQSLLVQVGQLQDGEGKGVFKRLDVDMRQFKNLEFFVHAESLNSPIVGTCEGLQDKEMRAFIRLGDDFQNNYYEYEIPLYVTRPDDLVGVDTITRQNLTWPEKNRVKIRLQDLVDVKVRRNFDPEGSATKPYSVTDTIRNADGTTETYRITVVGSPDLGDAKLAMLGVRNPLRNSQTQNEDDGDNLCAEVWFNELRLTELDRSAGYAAIARADIKLADLGNITLAGKMHTAGFGTLDQEIQDRFLDNYYEGNASATINLGRMLPKTVGLQAPVYAGYTQTLSQPKYDPYDGDVLLKQNIDSIRLAYGDDSARVARKQRQTITTTKSINITNLRKDRVKPNLKPKVWDIENFSATYAYTQTETTDPYIERDLETRHKGSLVYNYSTRPAYIAPFSKLIKSKSPYLALIRDFNFNFVPTNINLRSDVNRQLGTLQLRPLSLGEEPIAPLYEKIFTWDRGYGLKYNPARSITFDFNATHRSIIDEPQQGKTPNDTLWANIKRLGRPRQYTQSAVLSYNVPMDKIPFLAWTQLRTKYGSTYTWDGSPLAMSDTLGNMVRNSQDFEINGELNFVKLYSTVPFLKKLDTPAKAKGNKPKNKDEKGKGKDTDKNPDAKDDKTKDKKKDKNAGGSDISPGARFVLRPLLSLRRVSLTYNEKNSTTLPGFMPLPKYVGMNWQDTQNIGPRPGADFLFGYQPQLKSWLEWAAVNNFITPNIYQNNQVIQTRNTTLNAKINLEPIRDLKVDVTFNLSYAKNHNEFYKTEQTGSTYRHFSKIDVGNYSVTTFLLPTMFTGLDTSKIPFTFRDFEANRAVIANRFGDLYEQNTGETLGNYVDPLTGETNTAFPEGYGPYSQDVLLPAFLAAYKGKDAASFNLNPFNFIPLPNWKITYNGLNKLPWFKEVFTNFNLSHGYTSTMSVNNYRNNIAYDDFYYDGAQLANDQAVMDYLVDEYIRLASNSQLDTLSGNFASYFQIPQVTISEQLSPLIGIDATLKNGVTGRFDYKKSRILAMSFQDYQLSESRSDEMTIGASYKLTGLSLPLKFAGKKVTLSNELQFNFDFTYRNNITTLYRLDQNIYEPTSGTKTWRIAPSIDYVVSEKFRTSLFYEYTRSIPAVTTSFPVVNVRGGVRLNFTL